MKASLQSGKSFSSPATAQRAGINGLKTITDNRPTMVAQRKLLKQIDNNQQQVAQHQITTQLRAQPNRIDSLSRNLPIQRVIIGGPASSPTALLSIDEINAQVKAILNIQELTESQTLFIQNISDTYLNSEKDSILIQDIAAIVKGHDEGELVSSARNKEAVTIELQAEKKEGERLRLNTVTLSSTIHHLDMIQSKSLDVMTQPWGFSFADKKKQQEDVKRINEYIDKWNRGEITTPIHTVVGDKKQYKVPKSGITYSTHSDSDQLYPISGPEVYCGNGVGDMYQILKKLKLDDDVRVIHLSEAIEHTQSEAFKKASEEKKQGGHRSGVEIPKPKLTSAGNIKKMNQGKREKLVKAYRENLDTLATSTQYSIGQ